MRDSQADVMVHQISLPGLPVGRSRYGNTSAECHAVEGALCGDPPPIVARGGRRLECGEVERAAGGGEADAAGGSVAGRHPHVRQVKREEERVRQVAGVEVDADPAALQVEGRRSGDEAVDREHRELAGDGRRPVRQGHGRAGEGGRPVEHGRRHRGAALGMAGAVGDVQLDDAGTDCDRRARERPEHQRAAETARLQRRPLARIGRRARPRASARPASGRR